MVRSNKSCSVRALGRSPSSTPCSCAQLRYLATVRRLSPSRSTICRSLSPHRSNRTTSAISNTMILRYIPHLSPHLLGRESARKPEPHPTRLVHLGRQRLVHLGRKPPVYLRRELL